MKKPHPVIHIQVPRSIDQPLRFYIPISFKYKQTGCSDNPLLGPIMDYSTKKACNYDQIFMQAFSGNASWVRQFLNLRL